MPSWSRPAAPMRRSGTPGTAADGGRNLMGCIHPGSTRNVGNPSKFCSPIEGTVMSETSPSVAEVNRTSARRWIEAFNERDVRGEADARTDDYLAHAPASIEPETLDSAAW